MAKSTKALKFFHVSALPTTDIVTGGIYFNTTTGIISVYNGSTWENFGGQVTDASFASNVLTISKSDGTSVTLDFSDVASATNVNSLLGGLRIDVNNLQTATGIADGSTAPSWATDANYLTSTETTLKAGIEKLDTKVKAAIDAAGAADSKVGTEIGKLDYTSTGAAGSYIQKVSETDGIIAETVVAFDTTVGAATGDSAATDNNAPTSKAVRTAVDAAETAAKSYADSAVSTAFSEYNSSTNKSGKKLSGTISDNSTDTTFFVTAKQVYDFASGVTGAMHFIGTAVTTEPSGDNKTALTLGETSCWIAKASYSPASGDIILLGTQEYVYSGSAWQLFGDEGTYATKAQLEALDKADNVSDAASGITVKVDQTDGLISKPVVTVGEAILATDDTNAATGKSCAYLATGKQVFDAIAAVKGTLVTGDYTTIEALSDAIKAEASRAAGVEGVVPTGKTLQGEIDDLEAAIGVKADSTASPAVAATGLYKYIDDSVAAEKTRAEGVEGTLSSLTTTEKGSLVGAINEVSGAITTAIQGLDVSNNASDAVKGVTVTVNEVDGKVRKPVVAVADAVIAASTTTGSGNLPTGAQVHTFVTGITGTPDENKTLQGEIDDVESAINILNGANTVDGSVAKSIKTAVEGLDATVDNATAATDVVFTGTTPTADSTQIYVQVVEADGKLTGVSVKAAKFEAYGAAATAKSEVIGASGNASTASTIYGAKAYSDANKTAVIGASTDTASSDTITGAKKYADSLWFWDSWA